LLFSFLFGSDRKANAVTPELVKKLPFLEVGEERERVRPVFGDVCEREKVAIITQ
jgi:hypothetical protein